LNPVAIKCKSSIVIRCRACGTHFIDHARWKWNGDVNKPTLTPSVKETCNDPGHPSYQPQAKSSCCHFNLKAGIITYHGDCSHGLRGDMPLEPFTDEQIAHYNQPGYQE